MNENGSIDLSHAQMFAAVAAFFLPLAIDVILKANWSSRVKAIVAFLCYVVVAIGTVYFDGRWSPENAVGTVLLILLIAIGSYKAMWQPTGASGWVKSNVLP